MDRGICHVVFGIGMLGSGGVWACPLKRGQGTGQQLGEVGRTRMD
jgi:hypothetical protein